MYIALPFSVTLKADKERTTAAAAGRLDGKEVSLDGQVKAVVGDAHEETKNKLLRKVMNYVTSFPDVIDGNFKGEITLSWHIQEVDENGEFWATKQVRSETRIPLP